MIRDQGMRITLSEYLRIISARIDVAEAKVDKDECIRLGKLISETALEYVGMVEESMDQKSK